MLILKVVKVLCFDTLLQVLILKGLAEASRLDRHRGTERTELKTWIRGTPTPRVFVSKSAEVIENKGQEWEKERQESLRVCKSIKRRGLGLGWQEASASFRRDNTTEYTTDLEFCQE